MRMTAIGLIVSFAFGSAPGADGTISIDPSKKGPRVDPRLYGIFLEEINHGVDGGLYAELVRNRGFEDAKPPEGFTKRGERWLDAAGYDAGYPYGQDWLPFWSLVRDGGAKGSMRLDQEKPLSAATPRSLRLDVEDASGRIGIANEGFWGIGVRKGEAYRLSLHARAAGGFSGELIVTLEGPDGKPCSDVARIPAPEGEWRTFGATLKATRTEGKARLIIAATAKGTIWFDLVSLFPAKTFKGRPNGLRPDLAQILADLEPGFVRFPGGCVVEGGTIETAYDWKKTVGQIEAREEIWGAWSYRRTHGMGFQEYLLFCEDLGAEPLFVLFAGQSCAYRHWEHVPLGEMGWVIDRYIDAIEYANGPVDSRWGKLRAEAGHPAPFGLKWLEIGNENMGEGYEERYPLIYEALKGKHPEIRTIACFEQRRAPTEMVDHHYYNSPRWFLDNTRLYDRYDRKRPPVYVGEIAVTSGEGGPDTILATDVDVSFGEVPAIVGRIGVGTWDTSAEFKDVRVEKDGRILFESEFTEGAEGWRTEGGSWSVADGAYRQKDNAVALSVAGGEAWSDYTLSCKARKLGGAEGFLIIFGRKGGDTYWWNIGGWGNREHGIEFNRGPVGPRVRGRIETGRWYDIRIELRGTRIRCLLDGKLIHEESAPARERFLALAGLDEAAGEIILKAINTAAEPVRATVKIGGGIRVAPEARSIVLRSNRLEDNNTLEQPEKVVPVERAAPVRTRDERVPRISGSVFAYEFPSYSLTVLRLRSRGE